MCSAGGELGVDVEDCNKAEISVLERVILPQNLSRKLFH